MKQYQYTIRIDEKNDIYSAYRSLNGFPVITDTTVPFNVAMTAQRRINDLLKPGAFEDFYIMSEGDKYALYGTLSGRLFDFELVQEELTEEVAKAWQDYLNLKA